MLFLEYADNVTVVHFVRSKDDDLLQSEWTYIENWSRDVGLQLNLAKSCIMNCVTKAHLSLNDVFSLDGVVVPTIKSMRFLGVIFSNDFSWSDHVTEVTAKCYKRMYILRNLRRVNCSPELIYRCYVAFIRCAYLCISSLLQPPQEFVSKLLRVERYAARFFLKLCFTELSVFVEDMCTKLFRLIESEPSHSLRCVFSERLPSLRNPLTLRAPRAKTRRFSESFIRFGR